ncbi:type I-C CRISPR-associated protein Cas7/Csd2 [Streptomyces nigrescens]|uniref:Type I-C CRISPR-associated protein Cas7/Csd2 n=1 Tax=Streptomyces nigrescens TaxID=1920 RepID=A0A640TQP6_STRNI|nr:type I-C CRISPR-associated protein Cas7/Csd2 [Streptomyces libani]WAU00029.1 type I-C CRISPR-associated protein Cas7/Csd2 [Streptomyces libani subsp. libani]GFE25759.1 type I-C CRISPR-associated protein Cas7/Csd2 [Streptomyces libani subsp. libani]GGV98964.1 type I-C CRISPR-associated protein Cas7/Csd2 [Streptomyces libani subsp. libani]
MTTAHLNPALKHDYVFLIDVKDGNPNGDPDAGGMPRIDPITSQGLITDVAVKRKIRNLISLTRQGQPGYEMYVEEGVALNPQIQRAYHEGGANNTANAQEWMIRNFYDVRMFGAVMSVGDQTKHAGKARGPMQLTFSRSIDPITPFEAGITRVAPNKPEDLAKGKVTEMGNKHYVPYGLYRGHGFYSGALGTKADISSEDLEAFWHAMTMMFDHDRASSRGEMALRGLYIFSHSDAYGRAPAHKLFSLITIKPLGHSEARSWDDYADRIDINEDAVPDNVTLTRLIG